MSSKIAASELKEVLRGTKRAHAGDHAEPFFLIGHVVTVGEAQDFRMFGTLVKLAKARGAELDREGGKGRRELEGKAAGGRESIYTYHSTRSADWTPLTPYRTRRAVRAVTGPLDRMA
jgi:hypothetical protein